MGHAEDAVEMLTKADQPRAREIASWLETQNRDRQNTEKQIVAQALKQIEELGLDQDHHHAIVVGSKGWHPGVIGIVASRIVDRYCRPAVVVALEDEAGHGSGRSVSGFHLANALAAVGDLLESSGGHEMAAGLRVHPSRFEDFRTRFMEHAKSTLSADLLVPELRIEAEAHLIDLNRGVVENLRRLGPFGQGNPKPLLCCRGVELIAEPNVVGRSGDHLQLRIKQGTAVMKCIAFKFGSMAPQLRKGTRLDLAAEPTLNTYNGMTSVELDVKDIRL
jgi:single-stranded-DNA-specific exonuclease